MLSLSKDEAADVVRFLILRQAQDEE